MSNSKNDTPHSARVILAKIESLSKELTTNISFERREEIYALINELTERLREINEQNSK